MGDWLSTTVGVLLVALTLLYLYVWRSYTYWKRRGVPYLTPRFPFGNIGKFALGKANFGVTFAENYANSKAPYVGFYMATKPCLLLRDPEIMKRMLIKEFASFPDRGLYFNEEADPLSENMFSVKGPKWKILRNKISPTFTSGKMKMMFSTLQTVGKEMEKYLDSHCSSSKPVDLKDLFARFTTDVIGSCVFGLECNSLKNPNAEFRIYGDEFLISTLANTAGSIAGFIMPSLLQFFNFQPTKQNVIDFFLRVLKENIKYREEHNIHRNDFMDMFIKLKNNESIEDGTSPNDSKSINTGSDKGVTFTELAAQAFVFFVAGYEPSSTLGAVCVFELAKNLDIQDNVRKEIKDVLKRHNNELSYEAIMEMKYLDQVISETLRKYPVAPNIVRLCREEAKLTDDLKVEKGIYVFISVLGMHRDPKHYPNPDKFDPERFSEEEKAKRHPFAYIPFGEGQRNCVGARFGLLQAKMAVVSILKNHRFTSADDKEVEWMTKGVLLFPKSAILVKPYKLSD